MNKLKIKPFKHLIRKKQNSLRIKTIEKKLKNLPQNPGDTTVNPPPRFHRFRIILESGDTIRIQHYD